MTPNRSDALTLAVILACYGGYFWWTAQAPTDSGALIGGVVGLYAGFTVLITVAQVLVQLAAGRADAADREREARVGALGARNAYVTVLLLLWTVPLLLAVGGELLALWTVIALMGLAETVRFVSRIACRGAAGRQNHGYLAR